MYFSPQPDALATPLDGIEPRDETMLRTWAAVSMWLGGASVILLWTFLPGGYPDYVAERRWVAVGCLAAATFSALVFPRVKPATLYLLNNIFSVLGATAVFLACAFSGGSASAYTGLFFFPVLYGAYFYRAKHAAAHLVLISVATLALAYFDPSINWRTFAVGATVLIAGYWAFALMVGYNRRRFVAAEMRARALALTDPLTGVHNLRSFRERAECRSLDGTGLVLVDIDNFKRVNDVCGHTGADRVLQAVARTLCSQSRLGDCVARVGGDEFVVLAENVGRGSLSDLAERCAAAVSAVAIEFGQLRGDLSASVGFALAGEDGDTVDELLAAADSAMFEQKASGESHARAVEPEGRRASDTGDAAKPSFAQRLAAHSIARRLEAVFAERPARSSVSTAMWLGAACFALLGALALPPAQVHETIAVFVIAIAFVTAAFCWFLAERTGDAGYNAALVVALAVGYVGIYASGGTASPLLPVAILTCVFASQFLSLGIALATFVATAGIFASPFLYSSGAASLAYAACFAVLTTTAGVVMGIIIYSRQQLAREEAKSHALALEDALTGLENRRAFDARLERAIADSATDVGVVLIDLDNFKLVNDRHGHAAGDETLRQIAAELRLACGGDSSAVARVGGDEFALVTQGLDDRAMQQLGGRCIEAVARATARAGFTDCGVSASAGCAARGPGDPPATGDSLVELADGALMDAKRCGKRRVAHAA